LSLALLLAALAAATLALAWAPFRRFEPLERWVFATSGALLLLVLVSWVSMRARHYSPWLVGLGLLALASVVWRTGRRGDSALASSSRGARGGELLVVVLVALGALYAIYPTYFLLGGQDPGVYLLLGRWTARTGGLDVNTAWAHEAWAATHGALALTYPGLGIGPDPTRLIPQFVHLFPALLANAWTVGGLDAAVRANAIVAVAALANLFVLCRRLLDGRAALVTVLAVGLNPAFIWGARITLTEMLALWLNLLGLALLSVVFETGSVALGRAAGAVLGLGILNRLDAGLSVLAVFGFALAASVAEPRLRPAARGAASASLLASAVSYLDARINSAPYFGDLIERHGLNILMGVTVGVCLAAWLLAAAPDRLLARLRLSEPAARRATLVLSVLLLAWLAFALLVRPRLQTSSGALAARELGWYLTPVAWPLMGMGVLCALRERVWSRCLPLLTFAACSLFVYTDRTDITHQHIWASRRWLPHVIPLSLVLAALAQRSLFSLRGRARVVGRVVGVLAGGTYFALSLGFAQPFLFRSMLDGLPSAYERLANHVHSNSLKTPLVTANEHLASILTYVYDTPTMLTAANGSGALERRELAGREAVGFGAFELGDVTEYSEPFVGRYLEMSSDHPPHELVDFPLPFTLGRIGGETYEVEVPATHSSLGTLVGERGADGGVHTTGRAGTLQNGPWMSITPGQYEVDWIGRVWQAPRGKPSGMLDVIVGGGQRVLGSAPLRVRPESGDESWLGGLEFSVEEPLSDVEFRMQVGADVGLVLTRVRLRRVAAPYGGEPANGP
jgi:Dolichyl-phosphate-mannose-protein mannosyltransferase